MHLAGQVATLATCWMITRTAILNIADPAVDNLDVGSVFSNDGITVIDMQAGKYAFAAPGRLPANAMIADS